VPVSVSVSVPVSVSVSVSVCLCLCLCLCVSVCVCVFVFVRVYIICIYSDAVAQGDKWTRRSDAYDHPSKLNWAEEGRVPMLNMTRGAFLEV